MSTWFLVLILIMDVSLIMKTRASDSVPVWFSPGSYHWTLRCRYYTLYGYCIRYCTTMDLVL